MHAQLQKRALLASSSNLIRPSMETPWIVLGLSCFLDQRTRGLPAIDRIGNGGVGSDFQQ